MAADTTKQVRVDNWAVFFLQRLQLFFSKTDYCDMTLQFNGNVQLKVHKLVINACTDYFQLLEQTCLIDENTILMPSDLQADVIVPIINFMYTGMLEFQLSLYEKLYKTAQTMNITILTKLLEAQKLSVNTALKGGNNKKKQIDIQQQQQQTYSSSSSSSSSNTNTTTKTKAIQHIDLPAPLPGRKLPIWKRKSIPTTTTTSSTSTASTTFTHHENKWSLPPDPLSLSDNTPKPTRFEWPDDELPNLSLMDTSYESVSLTSKPLLTQEEEIRGCNNNNTTSTIFDDIKQLPNASHTTTSGGSLKTKTIKTTLDMEEMKNYIKEQKIRTGLSNTTNIGDDDDNNDNDIIDNDLDYNSNDSNSIGGNNSNKRKIDDKTTNKPVKRVRFNDNIDNNNKTTISVTTDGKSNNKLDHNKIVTEILKKYPQLVKENKNIRLKIMSKNNRNEKEQNKIITNINKQTRSTTTRFNKTIDIGESSSSSSSSSLKNRKKSKDLQPTTISNNDTEPWVCVHCSTPDETVEFVLYYLYRKHMTDYHNEKFDGRSCKYCGYTCNKNNMLYYHLYIRHGIRPPSHYNFPKCNLCPYIGLTQTILNRHRLRHNINEQQCSECKLAFTSHIALTSHIQITGHTGKTNKTNFDCQYCTKRYQSSVGLFIHVRMQHRNEAMRDGIVSIDEVDDYYTNDDEDDDDDDDDNSNNNNNNNNDIDENEQNDEYILPEIVNTQGKKVNILSNVKVTPTHQQSQSNQQQLLEPSSEAEALNNVASGIATSLGLVDIVVLNDNQQIFLQSSDQQTNFDHNQQQQQQQEEEDDENEQQTEFILPELSTTTTTTNRDEQQQHNQVITTDGVITQSMLTTDASTDELVMVLTDHDYGDGNQDEINSDNSNIVVLYSHPVEGGQQEQYITSQGNIMVNSRTGMIEIRNSAEVTSTSTNQQQQIDIDQQQQQQQQQQQEQHQQESHIESIEMIQREIESHTNDTTIDEDKSKSATQIDDNGGELEGDNQNNETVDTKVEDEENNDNKVDQSAVLKDCTDTVSNNVDDDDDDDNGGNRETIDDKTDNDQEIVVEDDKEKEKSTDNEETIAEQQLPEKSTDSTIEKEVETQLDNSIEETVNVAEQNDEKKEDEENKKISSSISNDIDDDDNNKEPINIQDDEKKDGDDKTDNDEILNDNNMKESEIKDHLHDDNSNSSITSQELRLDSNDENNDTDKNQTSSTTISDDSMKEQSNSLMKIAILDDWEDTDSQQSDNKDDKKTTSTTSTTTTTTTTTVVAAAAAATEETVNKLMDDWADEDEDEMKKD